MTASIRSNLSESSLDQQISLGIDVTLDLTTLIETRAIIQANSGGGKTWAIRRLLEQSHSKVQHIIIDVEGSLRTLREKYEYLLLGSETDEVDFSISPANAAQLVTPLLEARTSVILDLYEFLPSVRQQIVRLFLEALINAPKHLWHDCLVVIDEAHIFCPERGNSEAKQAVEALCSRGRARGFCAILATQRISKLGKDALGECNNKLIGRASLDVDMKRSNAELEFPSTSQVLKRLAPGEFYVFGPAISPEVQKITIGPVQTTHPKAGSRRQVSSSPPPESLHNVLTLLHSLPVQDDADGQKPAGEVASTGGRTKRARGASRPAELGAPAGLSARQDPQVLALLAEKDARIHRLQEQLDLLKSIKVSVEGTTMPVTELPAVLQLDHLQTHVAQATIVIERATGVPKASSEGEQPRPALRPAEIQTAPSSELLYSEAKTLKKLLTQIGALTPSEKLLFTWLVEHDGQAVSSQGLADAVCIDVSATWARQTARLMRIPFITRSGENKFWYRATFGDYARKYFSSGADTAVIKQQLMKAAQ